MTSTRTLTLAAAVAAGIVASLANAGIAETITQWNFNGPSAAEATLNPNIGFGAASLVGGTTASFASGAASGGSSDPAGGAPPNYAWNVTTFAAQGLENNQRGVQFNVSTVGFESIVVSWDQRHSNTSSAFVLFQYSLDGVNFIDGDVFQATAGDTWFNNRSVDLSSIAGASNNANFAFRIVATFGPAGGYVASNPTSNYGTGGTWRFDMVTVAGVIPAPGAIALFGLAGLAGVRRRRA